MSTPPVERPSVNRRRGRPVANGKGSGRDALLRAATTLFGKSGYSGTSIEDLLTAADVSAPTLYHHFGGKVGLFRSVVERAHEDTLARLAKAVPDGAPFSIALDALLAEIVEVTCSNAELSLLSVTTLVESRTNPDLKNSLKPIELRYRSLFEDIVARAAHRPDMTATRNLTRALVSLMHGITLTRVMLATDQEARAAATAMCNLVREGSRSLDDDDGDA